MLQLPARSGTVLSACVLLLLAACGGGSSESSGTETSSSSAAAGGEQRKRALAVPPSVTIPADANVKGVFGPVLNWPVIPVHAVLTPDGRVLSYGTDTTGRQTGNFQYGVWDPVDGSHLTLNNATGTDIFCSSQLVLPGTSTVFIAGGDNWTGTATTNTGNNNSNLFDAGARTLTRSGNMNRARWYSSSTTLLNGETYIQGGSGGTDRPEVRQANGSFRLLSGADTSTLAFDYPRNFIAPDGRIFGFDTAGRMYWVNAAGTGSITMAGQFGSATTGSDSTAAMFRPGRILQFGGNSTSAIVIDITSGSPVVSTTNSLARQRRLGTATILADGRVLASGGSSVYNELTNVAYDTEIWNPTTGTWTLAARNTRARLYHSIGLLLPDATVLVAGGGAPGPQTNLNGEIFYPPYLFAANGVEATRPAITTAPTVVDPGRTMQLGVSSGRPISRVTLVKTGSVTHAFNMEQRFVDAPFSVSGSTVSVQIPARASEVPPGTWMVFVFDDAGVPSVAKMLRINVAPALDTAVQPVITTPPAQTGTVGTATSLQISASDPNGDTLRYSASGLPAGLSIDPATGRIAGTPTTAGSYGVTVAVSDGINSSSASFAWTISASSGSLVLPMPPAPAPAAVGATATFTASASGIGVQYSWDFGDGSPATAWSTSGSASKAFANPGIYYVTVTARDSGGNTQRQTLLHQAFLNLTASAPSASSQMLLEPRANANPRLWVVNQDANTVSVFDAVTRAKAGEVTVGLAPRALALAPDGSVWVTNKQAASIAVINPATLTVSRTIGLPRASQPHGIAFARGSGSALVALEATGQLAKISSSTFAITGTLAVGANPRHVAVAADGSTAWVSRFISPPLPGEGTTSVQTTSGGLPVGGELRVVDSNAMTVLRTVPLAHSDRPDAENQGRGIPNYLGAVAISPDGSQAFVPSKQDNVLRGTQRDGQALNFQSTVRAVSSRVLMSSQAEDLAARIDHDNASVASAATFDPLGVYLFVALETSREVAVIDAHRRNQILRIDVGRAPQAIAVSADRRTLFVSNFMDRTVSVFDLAPLTQQGLAAVTPVATLTATATEPLTATVLRGKQFFYDARDTRLARDRYMSCATCHNDGGHDGRTWDLSSQGEGLRNTASLRGRAGAMGRLHWSNNFDEVQDFEGQIRTLAGGTGLMTDAQYLTGTRSQPLGDRKTGVSADLDALAAYVSSLTAFDVSPFRPSAGALSAAGAAGQQVFIAQNCASCHAGTAFTQSAVDNPANVGTIKPSSGQRLFGALTGIDVPTLRDVWATAPYLHDGSAPTLEAAVAAHVGVNLSATDLANVATYLREIGSEEASAPLPATSGAGLVGRYYSGVDLAGTPLLTRTEGVNFDWGAGVPGPGVPADNFSARWTGTVTIPTSGYYRFRTNSDDGVRLWVNGTQRINNWTDHGATVDTSASFYLFSGRRSITLEYYDRGGGATIQLQWLRPGTSTYVTIPLSNLNTN